MNFRAKQKWGHVTNEETKKVTTLVVMWHNVTNVVSHANIVSGDDDENTDWFCFPGGELEVDPRPNLTCNWKMIQAIYICKRLRNYWNAAKLLKHSQTGFIGGFTLVCCYNSYYLPGLFIATWIDRLNSISGFWRCRTGWITSTS